jgi:hypothetical protein
LYLLFTYPHPIYAESRGLGHVPEPPDKEVPHIVVVDIVLSMAKIP